MSATELLNWHVLAAALSGAFSIWSVFPYVGDILKGGPTKPNIVSFFLWTICEIIALFAQIKAGWSWSIVIMGFITFNTILILILSVCGYGYREYRWLDAGSLVCSILAIVLWQMTNDPALAIVLAIIADFFAAIPTLAKILREPHSEHLTGWLLITIASAFGALSSEILNVANLAFPIYVFLMNSVMLGLIYTGRKRLARTL